MLFDTWRLRILNDFILKSKRAIMMGYDARTFLCIVVAVVNCASHTSGLYVGRHCTAVRLCTYLSRRHLWNGNASDIVHKFVAPWTEMETKRVWTLRKVVEREKQPP